MKRLLLIALCLTSIYLFAEFTYHHDIDLYDAMEHAYIKRNYHECLRLELERMQKMMIYPENKKNKWENVRHFRYRIVTLFIELKDYSAASAQFNILEQENSILNDPTYFYIPLVILCDFRLTGKLKSNELVKFLEKRIFDQTDVAIAIYLWYYSGNSSKALSALKRLPDWRKTHDSVVSFIQAQIFFEEERYDEALTIYEKSFAVRTRKAQSNDDYIYSRRLEVYKLENLATPLFYELWLSLSYYKLGNTAQAKEYFGKFKQNYNILYEGDEFKAEYAEFLPPDTGLLPSEDVYDILDEMVREFEGEE